MRLTISQMREEHFGTYHCVSKNSLGAIDGTIKVYSTTKLNGKYYFIKIMCVNSLELPGKNRKNNYQTSVTVSNNGLPHVTGRSGVYLTTTHLKLLQFYIIPTGRIVHAFPISNNMHRTSHDFSFKRLYDYLWSHYTPRQKNIFFFLLIASAQWPFAPCVKTHFSRALISTIVFQAGH